MSLTVFAVKTPQKSVARCSYWSRFNKTLRKQVSVSSSLFFSRSYHTKEEFKLTDYKY
jgi:hypothetical protein